MKALIFLSAMMLAAAYADSAPSPVGRAKTTSPYFLAKGTGAEGTQERRLASVLSCVARAESPDREVLPILPSVSFNGHRLEVQQCRISAMPFNRVWTGVQRTTDQTRIAGFVTFDLAETGTLEISGCQPDATPVLFPLSESNRLTRTASGFALRLDRPTQYVLDFGRHAPPLHVFADPVYRHTSVPGELYFGPGVHEVDIIAPTNGQTVVIDRGAVVKGAIFLDHVTNVTVVGRGILDNSGFSRDDPKAQAFRKSRGYPPIDTEFGCHACVICGCENVRFEGFVIKDTPFWALIVRSDSRHVMIDNVKIVGQWRYNSDGIDVSASSDVVVRNCFVRSFDDCLVVLGAYVDKSCNVVERIRFENCRLWCDWGASFKLWSPSGSNVYRDILVKDCALLHVFSSPLHVKDTAGGADTRIENVRIENLEFDLLENPLRGVLQKTDAMRYPGDNRSDALILALVACIWPKTDQGNQKFVRVQDPSGFKSRIANVSFSGFTFPGICPKLRAEIYTEAPNQLISNVTFQALPPVEIRKRGAVRNVQNIHQPWRKK